MDPQAISVWLSGEIGVLSHVSFWVVIGVVGVVIWRVLKHHYQGRLDTKDELIRLKDGQLQDYKDKLSGASPDEARKQIEDLERRLTALMPRRLSADQKKTLDRCMRGFPLQISVMADTGAPDVQHLVRDIRDTLKTAGVNVGHGSVMGIGNPPRTGFRLGFRAERKDLAMHVVSAFRAADLELEVEEDPSVMIGDMSLLVTSPAD